MFLNKIIETKKLRVAEQLRLIDIEKIRNEAVIYRRSVENFLFSASLGNPDEINIIAEIKRASPSKGTINNSVSVTEQAAKYVRGGAAAISVLTEEDFFKGSLADLTAVRQAVDLPLLRKDFTVNKFQIYEAAAAGADAILLIVAALSDSELTELLSVAEEELGIDALVEVHTKIEFERAVNIGAKLIGVNNRDLHTFDVSLEISRELITEKPAGTLMISESGVSKRAEIDELKYNGFDGFLIGETLMRSGNIEAVLQEFTK